jgi:prepilin-type N-terminal cleavage/methylation domain-containing protein
MKNNNNKAFTFIELLVVVVIIAIVLAMVAAFTNIFKFLFWVAVYFSIPGIIFGGLLKLNQKYRWVVKGNYGRYIVNFIDGEYMDNDLVNIHLNAYFIIWPIYIPCFIAWIGGKELYHRYIKTMIYNMYKKKDGFFSIPTFGDDDKK